MKHLNITGKIIIIITAVSIWVFVSARTDYKWADSIIEQETQKGWTIIAKQDDFADITAPWTLIKSPVTGLWFIDENKIKKINRDIYVIHTLRVSYDYSRTEKEKSIELVNIKTRESAILDPEQAPSSLNINKLKWYKYKTGTPGYEIIDYMVNYEK